MTKAFKLWLDCDFLTVSCPVSSLCHYNLSIGQFGSKRTKDIFVCRESGTSVIFLFCNVPRIKVTVCCCWGHCCCCCCCDDDDDDDYYYYYYYYIPTEINLLRSLSWFDTITYSYKWRNSKTNELTEEISDSFARRFDGKYSHISVNLT